MKFLTVDGLVLSIYTDDTLINKEGWFTLRLANGRIAEHFMHTYFPQNHRSPMFALAILEGNPQDRLTWKLLTDLGLCYVNLLGDTLLTQWYTQYSGPTREDELFYYDIPIAQVRPL